MPHATLRVECRTAHMDDLDAIAQVWHESATRADGASPGMLPLAELRARIDAELADAWTLTVALVERRVVGMLAVKVAEGVLDQLFVFHSLLYLFPRECPRIVIWPTKDTSQMDREAWFGGSTRRAIAYVENHWLDRIRTAIVYRYLMPPDTFEDIDDVGMWVSRSTVVPLGFDKLVDLSTELNVENVELRSLPRLTPLKTVWQTTLHASGIRTRNALDWGPAGWSHSKPGRVVIQ